MVLLVLISGKGIFYVVHCDLCQTQKNESCCIAHNNKDTNNFSCCSGDGHYYEISENSKCNISLNECCEEAVLLLKPTFLSTEKTSSIDIPYFNINRTLSCWSVDIEEIRLLRFSYSNQYYSPLSGRDIKIRDCVFIL